jgi:pyridoxine 5-phosphate synthase
MRCNNAAITLYSLRSNLRKPLRLAVNIDHIATIRNARGGKEPDPVRAALVCETAGAKGIVCHLREDRRHIRDEDLRRLRKAVRTRLDLEMAATEEIIRIAIDTKPDLVTLVPEHRQELTTEGGLDVVSQRTNLEAVIKEFHRHKILVSLFVDPLDDQIETSSAIGSDIIEIHTGQYADATTSAERAQELRRLRVGAKLGHHFGMIVNAGHGLDYRNVGPVARIKEIEEVSIGHAIIVRAVEVGLERAVREMKRLVSTK